MTATLDQPARQILDFVTADYFTREPFAMVSGKTLRAMLGGALAERQAVLDRLTGELLSRDGAPPDDDAYSPTASGALLSSTGDDLRRVLKAFLEALQERQRQDPAFLAISFNELARRIGEFRVQPARVDLFVDRALTLLRVATATDRYDGSWAWSRPRRTEELVELPNAHTFIEVLVARTRAIVVEPDFTVNDPARTITSYLPVELRERFEMVHHIDDGAYASVFLVVDRESRQRFALKITRPAPDAKNRSKREVEAARALDHPHILEVAEHHSEGDWFLFPLADGTLGQLQSWGHLTGSTPLDVAHALCSALAHAHEHPDRFLHRDLHVNNVLRHDGRWKVSDWGLAVARASSRLTRTRSVGGVETWTAPEQLHDLRRATEKSDLFSVGRIVEWLVTGAVPDPTCPASLPRSHPLATFADACTQLDPAARPADVRTAMALLPASALTGSVTNALLHLGPRTTPVVPKQVIAAAAEEHVARIAQIRSGDTPAPIDVSPTIVLHVYPEERDAYHDLAPLKTPGVHLMPARRDILWDIRFNHDGLVARWPSRDSASQYMQVLRDGAIEFVDTYGIQRIHAPEPVLHALEIERDLVQFMEHWSEEVHRRIGALGRRLVCLTLLGIKDFELRLPEERPPFVEPPRFDREVVTFRPVAVEPTVDFRESLKPLFDAMWQAAGEDRSGGYTLGGEWIKERHPSR